MNMEKENKKRLLAEMKAGHEEMMADMKANEEEIKVEFKTEMRLQVHTLASRMDVLEEMFDKMDASMKAGKERRRPGWRPARKKLTPKLSLTWKK
jgi:hypothetical protein